MFYRTMLDSSAFAEVVTVKEPNKDDRQVYGKQVENEAEWIEEQYGGDDRELLLMRFGRNEAHEKGGIAAPKVGLSILRDGDSVPFAYTGKTVRPTAHSWTLVFTRPRTAKVG